MKNPLAKESALPHFTDICLSDVEPQLKSILAKNREKIAQLLNQPSPFTWDNLLAELEQIDDELNKMWSPISHMHSVVESEALRSVFNACLPLLTEYHTEIMQNEALYQAIQSIAESDDFHQYNAAQQKVINNDLRNLRLAGVHLSPEDKIRFGQLQKELSQLSTQFAENVLDSTHAWYLPVTDRDALKGLPLQAMSLAQKNAEEKKLSGWVFTLDYPSYSSAMKYLENRELRRLLYEAYVTRASEKGPGKGRWDNTDIMENILKKRHALAQLLGFKHYAEYSLQTKMATNTDQVLTFLNDLVNRSKTASEKERDELHHFAKSLDGIEQLEAWDIAYYSEKCCEMKYAVSQEDLRPYFPINKVLPGMFDVIHKLYGMTIAECHDIDAWHPSVQLFKIVDEHQTLRGYFYTDLYARSHKREGAWMDECRVRRRLQNGDIQTPVAFLTCNFSPPVNNQPALLTHDDVQTLFHEFGHCLHHLLTKVDYAPVSGINGVPWDAVEFPSQFLEGWCWEKEALNMISSHVETGESLPDELYHKLIASKNFHAGLQMLRQLEFSLFDFNLHLNYDPMAKQFIQTIADDTRKHVSVLNTPAFNRFQNTFSHIFAGSYGAGYYSYKWAEVLSSDAFSKFEENGIFDRTTGELFLTSILEKGGVCDPMTLFVAFRGREPRIDGLLRASGL